MACWRCGHAPVPIGCVCYFETRSSLIDAVHVPESLMGKPLQNDVFIEAIMSFLDATLQGIAESLERIAAALEE